MHALRSAIGFFRRHLRICMILVVLVLLAVKPVTFPLTHLDAFDCGNASIYRDSPSMLQQVATCFFQAHQRCSPATVRAIYLEVDLGSEVDYFTANALGGCAIALRERGSCSGIGALLLCVIFPWVHDTFLPDETCQSLSLKPTELDLQGCGNAGDAGPMIRWDRIPQ